MPQTLYTDTQAPGATPLIGPRSTPNTSADSSTLPAAVLPVCVPWPLLSRAVWYGSAAARPGVGQVGVEERRAADQLVVADERVVRRRQRVVAEVARARLTVERRAAARGRSPWSANDGCSGQAPLSRTPKMTPVPARLSPPSAG